MSRSNIQTLDDSLELPIGARFYFRNSLFEVAEFKEKGYGCSECAFSRSKRNEEEMCDIVKCAFDRHDDKSIYFKEVKETKEETHAKAPVGNDV